MEKSIVCLECESWRNAYLNLSLLLTTPGCRILEFGQMNHGQIIIMAESDKWPESFGPDHLIENPHKNLLDAYFKLNIPRVDGSFCIIENDSLSLLLKTVNICIRKYNFNAMEIYRACNGYDKAWALLCNGNSDLQLDESESFNSQIQFFPETSEELKNFLN